MKSEFDPKRHVFALGKARYGNSILFIVKIISPQGVTAEQLQQIKEKRRGWGNMNNRKERFKELLTEAFKKISNCDIEINTGSNCL